MTTPGARPSRITLSALNGLSVAEVKQLSNLQVLAAHGYVEEIADAEKRRVLDEAYWGLRDRFADEGFDSPDEPHGDE